MTSPVVSVSPDDTVLQAAQTMLQRRISGLPVIDKDGRLVGMVTEGDLLRRVETGTRHRRARWLEFLLGPGRLAEEYTRTHGRKVNDVMTTEPLSVAEDAALEEIVKLMEKRQIKRVPVVRGEQIIGIVTRANLLHALAGVSREAPASIESSDAAIRAAFLAELAKEKWAPIALINPIVRDGVVELWGTITDERERQALIVAAENVPGVKAVRDHLAWVEPTTGMVYQPDGEQADSKAS
jgi:CBS domain-containing protein